MSSILVSIIIPVYHSELTLPGCLESINNQDHNNFEVIIIDSESSLDTQAISRIQKASYYNIEFNNIAAKRNFGASKAEGKILLFLDSDCLLPEGFFDSIQSIFQDQEIVAAGSHDFDLPADSHWINYAWQVHFQVWSKQNTSWIPTRCLAVRRSSFEQVKGFNEQLITCEDVDLGYRLNNYGRILNSDRLKITHVLNPKNLGQFFMKELWHGLNSLSISIKNRSNYKEIIYLIIPVYFVGMFLLLLLTVYQFVFLFSYSALVLLVIGMLPAVIMSLYTVAKRKQFQYFPGLSIAYLLYLMARGAAACKLYSPLFIFEKKRKER